MLLISSSRKPSRKTRTLARQLAKAVPHSRYITRGKKNIDALCSEARRLGYSRIAIIYEKHGNPSQIHFIENHVDSWEWLPEIIQIEHSSINEKIKKAFEEIKVLGENKDKITKLFNTETSDETENVIEAEKNTIKVKKHKKEFVFIKYRIIKKEV
ncbi:hypothetical protein DRN74_03740 [Candidatus Micrarchaeota archaeon]|nr:MAG: hypothetical protein DRN74_03740 [Candidatus Micrarchaeota archaeon]